jgi:phosphate transport system substrate-binding protein
LSRRDVIVRSHKGFVCLPLLVSAVAVAISAIGQPSAAAATAAPTGAGNTIQVKGSDTIGGKLGQELARAFMERHPGVTIKWEALGSGTAFVGLLDGSADLGASSRAVKESEIAEARQRGVELREFVIGYDGIAVIVGPDNPSTELTVAQLSDLFTGKIRNWSEVGGPDLAVHVLTRPSYSGTSSFFRDKVLRRGNDKGSEDYVAGAEVVEENGALVKRVAAERGAVSYVGIGWVTPEVKALGVALRAGQPAVHASVETVRTGTYPIYRPLLMYSRGEPHGAARELLAFILSGEGRAMVARNDFVQPDVATTLAPEGAATAAAPAPAGTGPAAPRMVRVVFPRATTLTASARAALDGLAGDVKASAGAHLLVVGHADTHGSKAANQAMSLARANAVAHYLEEQGVPASAIRVEGHGADEPVATNQSGAGRGGNRRVDVTVLPAAAAAAH